MKRQVIIGLSVALFAVVSVATCAGAWALTHTEEVGLVRIHAPNGWQRTYYIRGEERVNDSYLADNGWHCRARYDKALAIMGINCAKRQDQRRNSISCAPNSRHARGYIHIDTPRGELVIETGCTTQVWDD